MQRLEVRAGDLEIPDARVAVQLVVKQPRGVLDELDVGAVQLGEGLLVLAPHHHLRLRLERAEAVGVQVLDDEMPAGRDLDADAGLAALGVRDRVDPAPVLRMLRQLRRARAGRGVDKIKMEKAPVAAGVGQHALERDLVILPALESAAQAALPERPGEPDLQPRVLAFDAAQVGLQDPAQPFKCEDPVPVVVERAHDAAHVDALELGLERDGAGHLRLQREHFVALRAHLDRQPEIRDAHMLDGHLRALDGVDGVHHVGQFRAVGGRDLEPRVVAARDRGRGLAGGAVEIQLGFGLHACFQSAVTRRTT